MQVHNLLQAVTPAGELPMDIQEGNLDKITQELAQVRFQDAGVQAERPGELLSPPALYPVPQFPSIWFEGGLYCDLASCEIDLTLGYLNGKILHPYLEDYKLGYIFHYDNSQLNARYETIDTLLQQYENKTIDHTHPLYYFVYWIKGVEKGSLNSSFLEISTFNRSFKPFS